MLLGLLLLLFAIFDTYFAYVVPWLMRPIDAST